VKNRLCWQGSLAVFFCLTILVLAGPATAQTVSGDDLVKAISILKSQKPTADDKKFLDKVFAAHAEGVFKKAGVKGSKEEMDRFKGNTVLTLQILDIMAGGDQATLKKLTLDDLVAVSFVLMKKMKDIKATEKELNDEKWRNEKLIPAVIQELAKMGKEQGEETKEPAKKPKKK
jgi:hypothetical protein